MKFGILEPLEVLRRLYGLSAASWARPGPSIDASRLRRKLDPEAGRAPMRHPGVPRGVPN
jgi:hypothetical protein